MVPSISVVVVVVVVTLKQVSSLADLVVSLGMLRPDF